MSNATKYPVEFIVSGSNLDLKKREQHTGHKGGINAKTNFAKDHGGSLSYEGSIKIDDNFENSNVIEARYNLSPGETSLIHLEHVS
jgi:hypothetical protein